MAKGYTFGSKGKQLWDKKTLHKWVRSLPETFFTLEGKCSCCGRRLRNTESIKRGRGLTCHSQLCQCAQGGHS